MTEWTFTTVSHYCWIFLTFLRSVITSFIVWCLGLDVFRGHDYINVKEKTNNGFLSLKPQY